LVFNQPLPLVTAYCVTVQAGTASLAALTDDML
jgi:hypothetical protein